MIRSNDLKQLAEKIASDLRLLADAAEKIGRGGSDIELGQARRLLEGSVDHYWNGIVVGEGQVQRLLELEPVEDEEESELLQEAF